MGLAQLLPQLYRLEVSNSAYKTNDSSTQGSGLLPNNATGNHEMCRSHCVLVDRNSMYGFQVAGGTVATLYAARGPKESGSVGF